MTGSSAGAPADLPAELPAAAWLVALADLPDMGPARLSALLALWAPEEAWRRVSAVGLERGFPEVAARWRRAAGGADVAARWGAHQGAGVALLTAADPGFPAVLAEDHEPPATLFVRGDLAALERPRVALVGTRRCTHAGRVVAAELGRDLAAAGVCVVSGLALGVDGAAHTGALEAAEAAPVAVVATGLDVRYPRRHAELWAAVASAGAVVSEYPLGTSPERWRFPARNRLIAALADVVVVVESHARGGSMHTVEAAVARDRPVMAVPGSVRSPASAGTNALLAAGCAPARDAGDVLVALGLDVAAWERGRRSAARRPPPTGPPGQVLDALGGEPATLEQLAARTGRPLGALAVDLSALERDGWVARTGGWYERTGGPS